jgi:PAS domain S-box-containing protein
MPGVSNTAMLGLAALVLMLMVGVSYREWGYYLEADGNAARIGQIREVSDSVDTFLASVRDAESSQRGFLLTGEARYLEPYNQAAQAVPRNFARLKLLLASRPADSADLARLGSLVDEKMSELGTAIDLRRSQGLQAAVALVLTEESKRSMEQIRAACAEIKRREYSHQSQASMEGAEAAQTALLATVAGSLVLLYLFAFGFEPFTRSADRHSIERPWHLRYGATILALIVAILLRKALTPVIGPSALPFIMFFPAVLFAGWFGGFTAGALAVVVSSVAAATLFSQPASSVQIENLTGQVGLLMFVLVGFGMSLLGHAQRRALERAVRAENAEREERRRFEKTLDTAAAGLLHCNRDFRYLSANRAYARMVGVPLEQIVGHPMFEVLGEAGFELIRPHLQRVLRGERVEYETELPYSASGAKWVHVLSTPDQDDEGNVVGWVASVTDISDRKRAEEDVRRRAEEVQALIAATPAVVWIAHDPECKRITGNQTADRLLGVAPGTNVSQTAENPLSAKLFRPDGSEMPARELPMQRAAATGEAVTNCEFEFWLAGGRRIHILGNAAPLFDAEGKVRGSIGAFLDISERKRAEQALHQSELAAELLRVQDEERRRIGRELHDSAGQNLVMLKMHLDSLVFSQETGEATRQKLENCVVLADETIKEVRTTSYALYPPMLEDVGLKSAIPWYLDVFRERSGIETRLKFPSDFPRPSRDVELAIFRVLQESLTNVLRHSGSHVADIRVEMEDGTVRLEVADQGKGIPPDVLDAFNRGSSAKLGVGLRSMQERIRQLGGKLEVISGDSGTIVRATVACGKPLNSASLETCSETLSAPAKT